MEIKSKDKKNQLALMVGAGLILFVAIISISRSNFFEKKNAIQKFPIESGDSSRGISTSQMEKWIKLDKNLAIVDVRDEESFKSEHILDSINIPIIDAASYIAGTGNTKNYVIIDSDGQTGSKIAKAIVQKNKDFSVYYMIGGFSQWKADFKTIINDADPASFTDQAKVKYITSDELKNLINKNSNIYIMDVRDNNSFNGGHIKNAANIPLDELEKRRSEIPLGKQIILCDDNSLMAYKAAVKLFNMGTFGAKTLFDGLDSWKQKGFEITR